MKKALEFDPHTVASYYSYIATTADVRPKLTTCSVQVFLYHLPVLAFQRIPPVFIYVDKFW